MEDRQAAVPRRKLCHSIMVLFVTPNLVYFAAVASQAGPASAHGRQEEMQTPSGSTRLTQNAAEALVAAPKGDRPVGRKDCDDAVMDSSNSGLSELSQASCSTMATSQEDSGHAATLPGSFRERYR